MEEPVVVDFVARVRRSRSIAIPSEFDDVLVEKSKVRAIIIKLEDAPINSTNDTTKRSKRTNNSQVSSNARSVVESFDSFDYD